MPYRKACRPDMRANCPAPKKPSLKFAERGFFMRQILKLKLRAEFKKINSERIGARHFTSARHLLYKYFKSSP
jgi:hypothetical protein